MLYEDYATTDPVVIEKLSTLLNRPSSTSPGCARTRGGPNIESSSAQVFSFEGGSSSSPTTPHISADEEASLCQGCSDLHHSHCAKRLSKKFLALCINTGRFNTTLGEIDVTNICRDDMTFRMIKERYLEVRGFRARARRLFLFQPNNVHFVKACPSNLVLSFGSSH
jgi:hypothetical protein